MAKSWVKQEIKKDWTTQKTEAFLLWIKNHREYFIGTVVTLIALLLVALYSINRLGARKEYAWEKFVIAQQLMQAGKSEEAFKQIDLLEQEFPRTDAASYGTLLKADTMYRAGNYKEAAQTYKQLIVKAKPALIVPFAMSGLAAAIQAQNDISGAIAAAQQFLDKYPEHFLAPQVYLTLAESLEASGKAVEAKTSYEKITLHFPDTYWARIAKAKLTVKK